MATTTTTNDTVTRQGVYDATSTKVAATEEKLKTRIDSLMNSGTEISQGDLLGLQYEMQSNLMVYNVASTIQKELNDMIKSVISKI
jgi:hypothetical protein